MPSSAKSPVLVATILIGLAAAAVLADAASGGWDTVNGALPLLFVAFAAVVLGRARRPGQR